MDNTIDLPCVWRHGQHTSWTPERDKILCTLIRQGYSQAAAERELGISATTVRTRCKALDIHRPVTSKYDVARLRVAGLSHAQIAREVGCSPARVGQILSVPIQDHKPSMPIDVDAQGCAMCGNCIKMYWSRDPARETGTALLMGTCSRDGHRCARTDWCKWRMTNADIKIEWRVLRGCHK